MQIERLEIGDIVKIVPARFGDNRGYFSEVFKEQWFRQHIADVGFVQDNQSLSASMGTVRGLHFQLTPFDQGKLVRCIAGSIFDVAVDIRTNSPTYGKWVGAELTAENGHQLFVPVGFAHAFLTLEEDCEVTYKVSDVYAPDCDGGIRWDSVGIDWPMPAGATLELSDKDTRLPALADFDSPFVYDGNPLLPLA